MKNHRRKAGCLLRDTGPNQAHMISREGQLLLAPGGIAAAGVGNLLLQALLQALHLSFPPLCQRLVEIPAQP